METIDKNETGETPSPGPEPMPEEIAAIISKAGWIMSPAIQETITKIPSLIEKNIASRHDANLTTSRRTLIWAGFILFSIIMAASVLTYQNKLSTDAAGFLFGAVVTGLFTFIRNFVIAGRT